MAKKKPTNIKQKNRAKHKKGKLFDTKMTKSVFLYGMPNAEKRKLLEEQQRLYTNAINTYIDFLYDIHNYDVETFISILNNTTKSPLLRKEEKKLREFDMNPNFWNINK